MKRNIFCQCTDNMAPLVVVNYLISLKIRHTQYRKLTLFYDIVYSLTPVSFQETLITLREGESTIEFMLTFHRSFSLTPKRSHLIHTKAYVVLQYCRSSDHFDI